MKARITSVAPERMPLYASALAPLIAEVYGDLDLEPGLDARLAAQLTEAGREPATLLLAAELVDPSARASSTCPAGYVEASFLLTLPERDGVLGRRGARMRLLYTVPAHRSRGLAASLLTRAEETLRQRRAGPLLADVVYGDDALTGIFERRGFVRGRMLLEQPLDG